MRKDYDLSPKEIADLLHVRQATYSRYESGVLDFPTAALIQLARFYKISVDYSLDLTINPTQHWK